VNSLMKRELSRLLIGFVLIFDVSFCSADETSNVDSIRGNTFCTQDEIIVFSCELENKKTVSLCGKDKQMRYSYGSLRKAPEFTIEGGKELFVIERDLELYGEYFALGFIKSGYKYFVIGSYPLRHEESVGLLVLKDDETMKYHNMVFGKMCKKNIFSDNKVWKPLRGDEFKPITKSDFLDSLELQTFDDPTTMDLSNFVDVIINNEGK